jgi:hypothetical protein
MAHADPSLHEHEWRASQNMPPLSREDIVSIAVAALGTAAVVLIAVISRGRARQLQRRHHRPDPDRHRDPADQHGPCGRDPLLRERRLPRPLPALHREAEHVWDHRRDHREPRHRPDLAVLPGGLVRRVSPARAATRDHGVSGAGRPAGSGHEGGGRDRQRQQAATCRRTWTSWTPGSATSVANP